MSEAPRRAARRLHPKAPVEDVERELAFHIAMRTQDLIDAGVAPDAAHREAFRAFGDYAAVRRECTGIADRQRRSSSRAAALSELVHDLRHAFRWLLRQPAFTILAMVALALGIGANTAIFSIVHRVLVAPLPYPEADDLVSVWERTAEGSEVPLAWPNFEDWRKQSKTLSELAAYWDAYGTTIRPGGFEPTWSSVAHVSRSLFATLGVQPMHGEFTDQVGNHAEVVVGEAFWRDHLGAEPDLSRLRVEVAGVAAQVVAVMPTSFDFPAGAELWLPFEVMDPQSFGGRSAHNFKAIGRLAPGADERAVALELEQLALRIRQRDPESEAVGATVRSLGEQTVAHSRRALLILLGASGAVLLAACANLGNALLGRSEVRQREMAVRASMGASRGRLLKQLTVETLLLGAFATLLGVVLAHVLVSAARATAPLAMPRLAEVGVNGWVLGFTTLAVLVTTLVFNTVPVLRGIAAGPHRSMLKGACHSPRRRRLESSLVAAEVAFAVLLLFGSGLLIRSLERVMRVDPGFDARQQLAVTLSLPESEYREAQQRVDYYDDLLARISALPGVQQAAVTMALPLVSFNASGKFYTGEPTRAGTADYRVVSSDFFKTMRIPVLRGRTFSPGDLAGAPGVVVINQAMADRFFSGVDPLGQRITTGGMDLQASDSATIVGIVGNVRHRSLEVPAAPAYYLPYSQRAGRITHMTLLVRTEQSPLKTLDSVRAAISAADGNVAVEINVLEKLVSDSFASRRFVVVVLGAFAAIAVMLAGAGIYGAASFALERRRREIAVRTALGQSTARMLWNEGRQGLLSVTAGLVCGAGAAVALTHLLESMLFEVDRFDPVTSAVVIVALMVTGCCAVLIPARRVLKTNLVAELGAE